VEEGKPLGKGDRPQDLEVAPERLNDNSNVPESLLIPKSQIFDESKLPVGGRLLRFEKTELGQIEEEKKAGRFHEVSERRQVYVLEIGYDEYDDLRIGRVQDAKVISVIDAETGEQLMYSIAGKFIDNLGSPGILGI
jgi:hypothetical protein